MLLLFSLALTIMVTILVIESDEEHGKLIKLKLSHLYNIILENKKSIFIKLIEKSVIDVIIINNINFDILDDLQFDTPIILLFEESIIKKFSNKISDIIKKPLNFEELLWRINKIIDNSKSTPKDITIGNFYFSISSYTFEYKSKTINFTNKESSLLHKLLLSPNIIFSKDDLIKLIWGLDYMGNDTTIKSHIHALRKKLIKIKEFEIVNIPGIGYKLQINLKRKEIK